MKKAEFPKVIKVGQTKATIYLNRTHGCASFVAVWYEGAVRKRRAFGDIVAAEVHANPTSATGVGDGLGVVILWGGWDRSHQAAAQAGPGRASGIHQAVAQKDHATPHAPRKFTNDQLIEQVKKWIAEGLQVFCV